MTVNSLTEAFASGLGFVLIAFGAILAGAAFASGVMFAISGVVILNNASLLASLSLMPITGGAVLVLAAIE